MIDVGMPLPDRGSVRQSVTERLVNLLLFLTAAALFLVLMYGGFSFSSGPLRISASHIRQPLVFLLAASIVKVLLRGRRIGTPLPGMLRSSLFLFLAIVLIYSLPKRAVWSGDVIPARLLPLSILREFNLDLNEFSFLYETGSPYYLQNLNGHRISSYPPWGALLALPVYLLPVLLGGVTPQSHLLPELERLTATLITAASAILLYWALRRITRRNIAWLITLVYAFGTSSFSASSQELWQHGPAQFFLALTVYFLVRGTEENGVSAYAGFALASAIICRPVDAVVALPVVAYLVHQRREELPRCILFALPPVLLFSGYNYYYFGSPLSTGFASFVISPSWIWSPSLSTLFGTPLGEGLAGVMVSPARGLLIYSPILFFAFVGMMMVWRMPGYFLLKYLSLAPFPLVLLTAKWGMWWGGYSYGPRLLADVTPILCLYLYPLFERARSRGWLRYLLASLSALSIGLHALGAFSDGSWNKFPVSVDRHRTRLWSWVYSPPVYYSGRGFSNVAEVFSISLTIEADKTTAIHAYVSRFYRETFANEPDPAAMQFWVPFLRKRCNVSGFGMLADWLFDSTDLWNSRPMSPESLVTILYRSLLGRDPGRDGLAYWSSQMRQVGVRRSLEEVLPRADSESPLPIQSNQEVVTDLVARLFRELLKRDPDPSSLAYWVNYIMLTHDLVGPTIGFLSSAELEQKVVPLQNYVPLLHRAFLDRDPDGLNRAFYEERLRANLLTIVHQGFIASEEFQKVVSRVCTT